MCGAIEMFQIFTTKYITRCTCVICNGNTTQVLYPKISNYFLLQNSDSDSKRPGQNSKWFKNLLLTHSEIMPKSKEQ